MEDFCLSSLGTALSSMIHDVIKCQNITPFSFKKLGIQYTKFLPFYWRLPIQSTFGDSLSQKCTSIYPFMVLQNWDSAYCPVRGPERHQYLNE